MRCVLIEFLRVSDTVLSDFSSALMPSSISLYEITIGGSIRLVRAELRVPAIRTPFRNSSAVTAYPISAERKCCAMRSHFPEIDS